MAQGIPDYEELKLRIQPGPDGGYGVLAFAADGSTAQGTFTKPFSDAELDNFILRVGLPRRSVRAFRSSQMEEAKRFGSELFDALVSGDVREVYLGARRASDAHHRGLRVTLYLTGVPELMEIPWEFLYERRSFLSQSVYTPLVRSLDLKDVRPPVKVKLPIRVLGMVSRPDGFDNLDVDTERAKLETALAPAIQAGLVHLHWLRTATLSEFERTLGSREEIHVFHYIGHGTYDERIEGGILVLENRHGQPHEVTGEELGALLQDERSLRLAVLNACEGARTSHVDPFSGVASSLVHYGVPAVIGMQFEITDDAAITFADRLYTAIAQGFPVDAALAQARKAIFAAGNDVEFGTPVLFLRAAEARLFDVDEAAVPVPAAGDFALDLEHERTSWRLTIRNTGPSTLRDVAVRRADGEVLDELDELAPGRRQVVRWPARPGEELITVRACDATGSWLTERVTASVAAPPPEAPPPEQRRRRFEPANDRPLRSDELAGAGGFGYKKERRTLATALADDELVYRVVAANRQHTGGDAGLLALTDRRLVFAVKDGTWDEWAYSRIARTAVDNAMLGGKLDLHLIDGSKSTIAFLLDRTAPAEFARLLEEAGGRVPAAAVTPGQPHVRVLQRTNRLRQLCIELPRETHTLTYTTGVVRDTLTLDGVVLQYSYLPNDQGFAFTLSDGDRSLAASVQISLNATGLVIKDMKLLVDDELIYSG
jgi:hypothetical protein